MIEKGNGNGRARCFSTPLPYNVAVDWFVGALITDVRSVGTPGFTAIRLRILHNNSGPSYLKLGALTPDHGKNECNFQRSGVSAASFKGR
jgi:hypothetical protein